MKAIVNQDCCIGCGLCESICPEVFKVEAEKARVLVVPVPVSFQENCVKASESCPVECIALENA